MKVSRLQAERNREAVLGTASRMFRERGVEATSVVDIFKKVGLTHGALYVQFPGGKETLAAEAVEKAFADRQAVWEDLAANHRPTEALRAIIANYLSIEHRKDPGGNLSVPTSGLTTMVRPDIPCVRSHHSCPLSVIPRQSHSKRDKRTAVSPI